MEQAPIEPPADVREVAQVALELGIKRGTLSSWIYKGYVRQWERGERVYCSPSEVRRYIEERAQWRISPFSAQGA